MSSYTFKSSVFGMASEAQRNGDSDGWGTEFAEWLKPKLQNLGYQVLRTEPDTMGWTLRLQDEPFKLSVSFMVCEAGTASNFKDLGMGKDEGLWQCYASVSKPFFAGLFKKIDTQPAEAKIEQDLKTILTLEPGIELVAEPEFADSGFGSNSRDDS